MKKFLSISAMLLSLAACKANNRVTENSLQPLYLRKNENEGVQVMVELADTPAERESGLMHRTALPEGQGMLFIFDRPQHMSFWMKNTLIPLDILFINENDTVISVQTMVPCENDPCRTYPSEGKALYALELPEGFARRHGITAGWTIEQ